MTDPQGRIESDLKEAMKARDKPKVATLRLLLTEIKNERIRRGGEIDEATFAALVRKGIKQREEAVSQYRQGGRPELAEREAGEATLLRAYLPQQASEEELRKAIAELISERGLSGPAALGPVMKEMLARLGARADGGTISRIAREVLAGKG